MHNEPACEVIERAHHGHFLGLPRRRHTQIGAAFGPCTRQIGMRQRLALVAVKQHDVTGLCLGLAQLKPEPNALDLSRDLPPLQRVPWPPPPEVFFRSAFESCDGPISTSSRFLIFGPKPGRLTIPVVLVEDNGPIHVSKIALAALDARKHWLTVEWLPKYAPELNDIEVVWRDLKAHHLAHKTFTDAEALDREIHAAVEALNRERNVDALVNWRISA